MGKNLKFPIVGSSRQPPGREEAGLKGLKIGSSSRRVQEEILPKELE